MSDLAATNCSCSNTDNGCGCSSILWIILLLCCCCGNGNGGSFFGGNDCGSGNNSCIWAIILLFCCGGFGTSTVVSSEEIMAGAATMDVVTETAAGSLSYCFCCVAMDVAAAADLHFYCGSF